MMRGFGTALAGVIIVTAAGSALAEADHGRSLRQHPARQRAMAPPPRVCQRLCVADVTPCDPMEYKIADGRCSDPFFLY